ncbi:MAG: hypothetical protein U9P36_01435 [Thermodesulfobacteriota bacterium]|nr:hypothetical protein [Thermodesulfobacteriota bacterium]
MEEFKRARVEEKFTVERMVREYMQRFEQVAEPGSDNLMKWIDICKVAFHAQHLSKSIHFRNKDTMLLTFWRVCKLASISFANRDDENTYSLSIIS